MAAGEGAHEPATVVARHWLAFTLHRRRTTALLNARQRARMRDVFADIERAKGSATAFYKKVKAAAAGGPVKQQSVPAAMRRKDGRMTETEEEASNVWSEYYRDVSTVAEDDAAFDPAHFDAVRRAVRAEAARGGANDGDGDDASVNSPLSQPITLKEGRRRTQAGRRDQMASPWTCSSAAAR